MTPEQRTAMNKTHVEWRKKWPAEKLVIHRILHRRRSQLRRAVLYNYKETGVGRKRKMLGWLGCSAEQFKLYIQQLFKPGMTWNNNSEWDIDHIQPLATFDPLNDNDMMIAWHYTNMRPLWSSENRGRPKFVKPIVQPELILGV
jgi:hypothetical protein